MPWRRTHVDLLVTDNAMSGPTALANVDYFAQRGSTSSSSTNITPTTAPVIMSKFREAGHPVIAVDVPLPGATYFGVDNYVAGQIGGEAAAEAVIERWGGSVDRVGLARPGGRGSDASRPHAGPARRAARPRHRPDDQVVHIDRASAARTRRWLSPTCCMPSPSGLVSSSSPSTDEAALGAIDAIRQVGRSELAVVVSQGADAGARPSC